MAKKILMIILAALVLYVLSSLLTFSWEEVIPAANMDGPRISMLCSHPFGFPVQFSSWDMRCVADAFILFAQSFNVVFWLLVSMVGYWFFAHAKDIKQKFSRYPHIAWLVIIGGFFACVALLVAASQVAFIFTLAGIPF
jgi:hypothetical protein